MIRQLIAAKLCIFLLNRVALRRVPDFIVGADNPQGAYLHRWYLTPWRNWQTYCRDKARNSPTRRRKLRAWLVNWLPSLYLHCFLRDDDDRALHDHPSWAISYILLRGYIEHTIAAGGIHQRREFAPGSLRLLPTRHTHRIELHKIAPYCMAAGDQGHASQPCWTLFLFGPTVREWGFHCPQRGWVHWREFTADGKPGDVGKGCE